MVYRILKFILRLSLKAHYLQIKADLSQVPKTGPLIIAANHPNSFLDAIIIGCELDRPLYFLARGDVFRRRWQLRLMKKMNLIPVFQQAEGKDNLQQNYGAFEKAAHILTEEKALLIFVEGVSIMDRQLRPVKKSMGKIMLQALRQNPQLPLQIATVSINYDRPRGFLSKVLLANGHTINLKSYKEDLKQSPQRTVVQLNQQVYEELLAHTITVEPELEDIYATMTELDPVFAHNSLSRKIRIAAEIEKFSMHKPEEIAELQEHIVKAAGILQDHKLNFRKLKVNKGIHYPSLLLMFLSLPVVIPAFILFGPVYFLTSRLVKHQVKAAEFIPSMRFSLHTLLMLILTLLLTLLAAFYNGLLAVLVPLVIYFLLTCCFWFYEKWHYLKASVNLNKLRKSGKYKELQAEVKQIYRIRTAVGLTKEQ
jgi:1-acyl-sn-glycerol-3-phosphate acyltransferase